MRIAVIDDDAAFLDLLGWLFRDRGWDTVGFHGEKGTLPRVIRARPDIVILAPYLGTEESGWHLLDLLEMDPRGFHLPVIMCASDGEVEGRREWLAQRGVPLLRKPLSVPMLYATIEAIQAGPSLYRHRQAGA